MFVHVLRRIVSGELAVIAARGDNRSLEGEIDKAFQDARRAAECAEGFGRFARRLPLSPGPCRHSRSAGFSGSPVPAELRESLARFSSVVDAENRRVPRPSSRDEILFRQTILRHRQACALGIGTVSTASEAFDRRGRHVLEFEGDRIAGARRISPEPLRHRNARDRVRGADLKRGRVRLRRIDMRLQSEPRRGQRQHAARVVRRREFRSFPPAPRERKAISRSLLDGRLGDGVGRASCASRRAVWRASHRPAPGSPPHEAPRSSRPPRRWRRSRPARRPASARWRAG